MITFILSLAALVLGYIFYGRFVERVFGPDDRVTPAVSKADGLDYIVMPGWSNQALSVFTLWTVTVYLVRQKKNFWIMLIPALFMTTVCSTYVFISRQMLHLPEPLAYGLGIACLVVAAVWFTIWYNKQERNQQ